MQIKQQLRSASSFLSLPSPLHLLTSFKAILCLIFSSIYYFYLYLFAASFALSYCCYWLKYLNCCNDLQYSAIRIELISLIHLQFRSRRWTASSKINIFLSSQVFCAKNAYANLIVCYRSFFEFRKNIIGMQLCWKYLLQSEIRSASILAISVAVSYWYN